MLVPSVNLTVLMLAGCCEPTGALTRTRASATAAMAGPKVLRKTRVLKLIAPPQSMLTQQLSFAAATNAGCERESMCNVDEQRLCLATSKNVIPFTLSTPPWVWRYGRRIVMADYAEGGGTLRSTVAISFMTSELRWQL